MANPRIVVTKESSTGRNERFYDNRLGIDMTRTQFVAAIERGNYPNFHVREINNVKTPVGNPDQSIRNNLG